MAPSFLSVPVTTALVERTKRRCRSGTAFAGWRKLEGRSDNLCHGSWHARSAVISAMVRVEAFGLVDSVVTPRQALSRSRNQEWLQLSTATQGDVLVQEIGDVTRPAWHRPCSGVVVGHTESGDAHAAVSGGTRTSRTTTHAIDKPGDRASGASPKVVNGLETVLNQVGISTPRRTCSSRWAAR